MSGWVSGGGVIPASGKIGIRQVREILRSKEAPKPVAEKAAPVEEPVSDTDSAVARTEQQQSEDALAEAIDEGRMTPEMADDYEFAGRTAAGKAIFRHNATNTLLPEEVTYTVSSPGTEKTLNSILSLEKRTSHDVQHLIDSGRVELGRGGKIIKKTVEQIEAIFQKGQNFHRGRGGGSKESDGGREAARIKPPSLPKRSARIYGK